MRVDDSGPAKRVAARVLVLTALVLTAAGCGGGGQAAGKAAGKAAGAWGDDVARALGRARGSVTSLDDVARGGRGLADETGRSLDDLARAAPRNRTAEEARLLADLRQTRVAIGLAGTAMADANRLAAALPDDAARIAAATSRPDIADEVSRLSQHVLQDVACDAAAALLFPGERDTLEQSGYPRAVPDTVEAAGQSIVNFVYQQLAGALGGGAARSAVAWQQYASGILEKRDRYLDGMRGVIQSPNWTVTRAYYHYVRLCLALPG